jgi:S1-C subfamily serine protease
MGLRLAWALALALLQLVPAVAFAEEPSPSQKIALTAKPSVVRVWGAYIADFDFEGQSFQEAIGGTGTGFFITADGYLATNAHVVSDIYGGDERAKKQLVDEARKEIYGHYRDVLDRMNDAQVETIMNGLRLVKLDRRAYVVLESGEKLDYEVVQTGVPGSGRDCAIIKVKTQNAPALPIGDSTKSQVEDHIIVIGYPGVADAKDLLDEKSELQSSVTDGAISALKHATTGEQILQISAPITHGNSGGPAIDQHGNVVGLATFGTEVQGFNFLVASATLMDFVKDAKVQLGPSKTMQLWQKGLQDYWDDHYTDAISEFEEVETDWPLHPEAHSLVLASKQAQKDGKEKKKSDSTGIIVAAASGGAAFLALLIWLATRGKKSPPMPQPQPGVPGQPNMYGRAPVAPVAKTVAIQPGQSGGIAPTAFGSMTMGSLYCTRGQLYGQKFALTPGGIIIGRQPGVAHVLVNDSRASGKHVWIGMDQGRLVAIDQGTTNGTYVNDVMRGRITRQELRDGDFVIVGDPDCLTLQVKLS